MLDDVLQGIWTIHDAAAAYGKQPPGAGQRRQFPTFADYLLDRIAYAESPAVERRLRGLLASAGRRGRSWHAGAVETRAISRLMAETGQERAARLRELLAELSE